MDGHLDQREKSSPRDLTSYRLLHFLSRQLNARQNDRDAVKSDGIYNRPHGNVLESGGPIMCDFGLSSQTPVRALLAPQAQAKHLQQGTSLSFQGKAWGVLVVGMCRNWVDDHDIANQMVGGFSGLESERSQQQLAHFKVRPSGMPN